MKAVTQGQIASAGVLLKKHPDDSTGIDVIDEPGTRAYGFDSLRDLLNFRQLAERTKDSAWPDRIARAHPDAVFSTDLAINTSEVGIAV